MRTDDEMVADLHWMGIDEGNFRVLALLPLVQVAWADSEVQPAERELIVRLADQGGLLDTDGVSILDSWLAAEPSDAYLRRGRRLLVELAHRRTGRFRGAVDADTLQNVRQFCEDVAAAAGGLFGRFWKVDARESAAIREIAEVLEVSPDAGLDWDEVLDGLG